MSYADKVSSGSSGLDGVFIKASSYPGNIWKPKWDDQIRLETHIRPVGPLTADKKSFIPWRFTTAQSDFTGWLYPEFMFSGGTTRRVSFLAAIKDEAGNVINSSVFPSPAHVFVREAFKLMNLDRYRAVKEKLGTKMPGRGYPLTKINVEVLVQCIVFRVGAKDMTRKPVFPAVMWLGKSARYAFENALNEKDPEYRGSPDDINKVFKVGNPLDPEVGKMFSFYNARAASISATEVGDEVNLDAGGGGGFGDGGGHVQLAAYACDVKKSPKLPRNADGTVKLGARLFTDWDKALLHLSPERMVEVLFSAYEDLGKAFFLDIYRDHKEWLPKCLASPTTISTPSKPREATAEEPESSVVSEPGDEATEEISLEEPNPGDITEADAKPDRSPAINVDDEEVQKQIALAKDLLRKYVPDSK